MKLKKILKSAAYITVGGLITILAINLHILNSTAHQIYSQPQELNQAQAALILGSRVYSNGSLSAVLKDRVDTALQLYQNNTVQKLLVSGDHGTPEYDEVNAVKDYLLNQGVPPQDIFLDHAGFDTYDSLYRAKHIFQADSLIVVTQEFHLPRSLYIANSLELSAQGLIADQQAYQAANYNYLRESLARVKASLNVLFNSKPKFLGEKIPLSGDGRLSWD